MDILIASLIVLATFITMEGVAWAAHKYLMHGAMWYFHRDHHQHEPGFFEKNDAFFLIFAISNRTQVFAHTRFCNHIFCHFCNHVNIR